MNTKAFMLLGLLSGAVEAAELPPLVLPSGVGVNIHFTRGHEKDLDLIAAAGFKFIRMDFGWAGTERREGEYNWSAYDELTANLETRGLRPIYILDYSNPLYEQAAAAPQHPASVKAFAAWAAAAAQHFRGHHVIWEIWNEPNISFWKPKPDVQQYNTLALATCKAIREVAPQALIIGPASSEFPWQFLESFLSSGVLQYLDAISVHPYREYKKPPESATEDYRRLRKLIERYAPSEAKQKLPIISGEWGYATHRRGVSLETQAAYAVRQQLSNLLNQVPISIWYDWKNDGNDPEEREHNFGTVTPDLTPKPAYAAIRTLTCRSAGFRIDRRLEPPSEKDYVVVCTNATGGRKIAAWTLGESHSVALDLAVPNQVTGITGSGERYLPKIEHDRLVIDLDALPRYINLQPDR